MYAGARGSIYEQDMASSFPVLGVRDHAAYAVSTPNLDICQCSVRSFPFPEVDR